ncbi:YqaA family protein [candidate division KSB1 bacterium]
MHNEEIGAETGRGSVRRLYDWVLGWADTPYGTPALIILAFAESSFFPIPADVLLIALCLGRPKKSFYYALICSAGSVAGGIFGYFIGWQLMDLIGYPLLEFYGYGAQQNFDLIGDFYRRYDAWAVFIAGFTFIPYKVFTIAAGVFKVNFIVFTLASILGRSMRFFAVSGLIYLFGPKIKGFIDRYFNIMVVIFTILLIGGFFLIKLLF